MAMYYNTIIAWAVYYLVASFNTELPWAGCNHSWNTPNCMPLFKRIGNATNATSPAEEFFEYVMIFFERDPHDLMHIHWHTIPNSFPRR